MNVGIDARALIGPHTGIGRFLEGLVYALASRYAEHRFVLYAPRSIAFSPQSPNVRIHVAPGVRGMKGTIWLQTHVPSLARRDALDVFWGAMFHLPMLLPPSLPAVVTIHDLVHLFFPQTMRASNYWIMRALQRPSLRRAQYVTADSHAVAKDLERIVGLPASKVTVVYPGVSPDFHPQDSDEARRAVARMFGLNDAYLLAVATLEPRKNLHTVIRAFSSLTEATRKLRPLVIVGGQGWKNSSLLAAAMPLISEGSMKFLGYVPDEGLPSLYAAAALLVFPSLYEGFGLPVAEAMACGLPTLVSDIPVTREVAAEAARFVPPLNADAWAQAILEIVEDERQRRTMREAGLIRAARFSTDASAQVMMTVLEHTARAGSGSS